MGEVVIELDRVSANEGDQARVADLSLIVRRGEAVALVGSNASGKGLALKLCAGLEAPASGAVRLLGVDTTQASEEQALHLRQRVGFVFVKPALISNLSVYNNVALPLRYHTVLPETEIQGRVMARLTECGVAVFREQMPAGLTMGVARLAALARAMVMEPEILFVDEVLFGLDADDLIRFRGLLGKYRREKGLTIVATINAPTSLFRMMDRLVLLRDGRLVADCPPDKAPLVVDPMVQDFWGSQ
jgi:ABC-type transporter Mla maintaining outer membrane lipid asymmetry ATPase subunit MlaF